MWVTTLPGSIGDVNPEALLAWGSADDSTFERPPQPPLAPQDWETS